MPLIQGKSKKAFSKNVETEMKAGKPQDQSLAIAYSIKKKNRKKMAKGGEVYTAKDEKRPMPDDGYEDSSDIAMNSGRKKNGEDGWTDSPTVAQAQKPSPTKMSSPKPMGSDAYSKRDKVRRDDEMDLGDSLPPESDKAQPSSMDDEEGADRQGPEVPDMQREHSNGRKPYYDGGKVKYSGIDLDERNDEMDLQGSLAPGKHGEQPDGQYDESHDYGMGPANPDETSPHTGETESDMMRRHAMERASFARGGEVGNPKLEQSHMEPDDEKYDSIASAIMGKRKKYADGGMVELDNKEVPARLSPYDHYNEDAIKKELYDDDQLSDQPEDSNEDGDDIESDKHDKIDQIRRKMRSLR